jgi:site-specific DNA-methyltransferase (adenine-specific)
MITEALSAGYYYLPGWVKGKEFPRIQILSVADLLHGTAQLKMPSAIRTFKQAPKVQQATTQQAALDVG